jgi:GTP-binding protein
MGSAFLRHVARCRVILHVVDGSSQDPVGDFVAINNELRLFNPLVALKPQVVVLNKVCGGGEEDRACVEKGVCWE